MRILDFGGSESKTTASPSWARKVSRAVASLLFGDEGTQPVDNLKSTDALTGTTVAQDSLTSMPNMWRVHEDRKSMWRDIERMDSEDELVSSALDIIADMAVNFAEDGSEGLSFRVLTEDKEALRVIEELTTRLNLHSELWQIVREFVKHGNYLPEVLIDRKQMKIIRLKQTIPYQIYPNTTERGDKLPGWIVRLDKDVYSGSGQELDEWQICPFIFGAKKGYLGIPMLASARRNWQRLSKIEDGMAVARLTRAYDKYVHRIPVKSAWTVSEIMATIKQYRDSITKRKLVTGEGALTQNETPFDVNTDFYLPDDGSGTGGITALLGTNLQLGNLNDIYYHREKLLARLAVPIAFLQIMSTQKTHLKSGSVGDADIRFAAFMRRVHASLRVGLRRLLDLELVLNGIVPSTVQYKIELAEIRSKDPMEDAKIELTQAQAAIYFVEAFGALPADLLGSKYLDLNPDQQAMFDSFLKTDANKIFEAQIKAIETKAEPKVPGLTPGSGNNNKSKAARSTEQKPAAQSVRYGVEELVDLFSEFQDKVNDGLRESGIEIPEDAGWSRDVIRQNLRDIAFVDVPIVE